MIFAKKHKRMKDLLGHLGRATGEVAHFALNQQAGSITKNQIDRYKRNYEMLVGIEKIIRGMYDEWERPV